MHRQADPPSPLELSAGTTTVTFTWAGDRWEHELQLGDGRRWQSAEGAGSGGDPRWPQSPPLVEVSVASTAAGPAILGVGKAGRSHYSLCVAASPSEANTLFFELACRIHEPADWLGSTYRQAVAESPLVIRAEAAAGPPATIRWSYAVGPEGIRARGPAGATAPNSRNG